MHYFKDWNASYDAVISYSSDQQLPSSSSRNPGLSTTLPLSILSSSWPLCSYRCRLHPQSFIINRLMPVAGGALGSSESLHWRRAKVRLNSGGEINQNCHYSPGSSRQSRGAAQRLWFWKLHSGLQNCRKSWGPLTRPSEGGSFRGDMAGRKDAVEPIAAARWVFSNMFIIFFHLKFKIYYHWFFFLTF